MSGNYSPLRYPGGKAQLYNVVHQILECNNLIGGTYVEPFAGGAGLAIKLLLKGDVKRIVLNDIDPAIYFFWKAVLYNTEKFCEYIDSSELSVAEWNKQKDIFKKGFNNNELEFAFSVFYLNRTNVSGILHGGIIGGKEQKGRYKIDARFNKENLKQRIKTIALHKNNIVLFNLDAIELISGGYLESYRKILINFDPPYVNKGSQLYKNSFKTNDHISLFNCINKCKKKWIVTYDVCDFIDEIYSDYRKQLINVTYSVKNKAKKQEYMFFSKNINIPNELLNGGFSMQCMDKCRFCSILNGKKSFEKIDTPILEDENYFLLASIGAMIEGWSLVIPKKHDYSMKEHYNNSDFWDFTNKCINIIKKAYSVDKVIVFEHGANKFGSITACGTNHCHIHIVPMSDSLLNEIKKEVDFQKTTFSEINKQVNDSEYLLYADVNDKIDSAECYLHILDKPISQFFRKIIASKLGNPDQYDYKKNNNLDISNATFITLSKEI